MRCHIVPVRWLLVVLCSLVLTTPVSHAQDEPTGQASPLSPAPIWESTESGVVSDLAWGDVDNDGDLDLVVSQVSASWTGSQEYNSLGRSNYLYLNVGGSLQRSASWVSEPDNARSVAWADVDRDGDLDLVVGNHGANKIYLNQDGRLDQAPSWLSDDTDATWDLAVGDVNGDGWFDLVAGNRDGELKVYLNRQDAGLFSPIGEPIPDSQGLTNALHLADLNGDGLLDLFAVQDKGYQIYVGDGRGAFAVRLTCSATSTIRSSALWPASAQGGDWFLGLGLSDIAGRRQVFGVYTHRLTEPLDTCAPDIWAFSGLDVRSEPVSGLTVADVNGDGRLDLTSAWGVYLRNDETEEADFAPLQRFSHRLDGDPTALAWADVDADGDLDLALALDKQPIRILRNDSRRDTPATDLFGDTPLPEDVPRDFLSWADVDNDGDYDLLYSLTSSTDAVQFRLNQDGVLGPPSPLPDSKITPSVFDGLDQNDIPRQYRSHAWGDFDGDGLIDLALAIRFDRTVVYRNTGSGDQPFEPVWRGGRGGHAVAWGDVDQDGDLDLAVGRVNEDLLYLNENGTLSLAEAWQSTEFLQSDRLTWADVDGDGDVDLLAATDNTTSRRVYLNDDGALRSAAVGVTVDLFVDELAFRLGEDGPLYRATPTQITRLAHQPATLANPTGPPAAIALVAPGKLAPALPAAQAGYVEDGTLAIEYTLSGPVDSTFDVLGYYSTDRGVTWQPSRATAETVTVGLGIGSHRYTWDIYADGIVGRNDDVRFRVQARPGKMPTVHGRPGPYQLPYVQIETLAFRVAGKQVRVVGKDGNPVPGAVVFRQSADTFAPLQIVRDSFGIPASTGQSGYLNGRAPLFPGDQLIALSAVPTETVSIPFTDQYTLFYTSGAPTESGAETATVGAGGVQTLTISPDNRLLLFHLNVSLEWDARNEPIFLQELEQSFQQASALLYDVTNGQVALGQINLFHNKAYWGSADIVIHADNSLRPSAAIGGIVSEPVDEILANGDRVEDAYLPGQIHMGTVWDPYGERTAELGEEWNRTLAHELAHYLLFLPDNYLGYAGEILRRVTCPDSFMTTSSDPGFSELLTPEQWNEDRRAACLDTLAARTTGRSDWETVEHFYGDVLTFPPALLDGPSALPVNVTYVQPWAALPAESDGRTLPLASRNFDLRNARAERLRLPDGQAYLFKTQGTDDLSDDVLIRLGTPTGGGDRLKVRGASPGDRLCVFASSHRGCEESLTVDTAALTLDATPADWNPRISVRAVTSRTVAVSVEQLSMTGLMAQVYPMHYGSLPGAAATAPLASDDGRIHAAELTLGLPAFEVAVRVWAEGESGQEAVTILRMTPPSWGPFPLDSSSQVSTPDLRLTYAPIGGPINVPTGGPINVPTGGPINVPTGGPINVPTGGPINVPTGGPINVPTGGPINVPTGGPINVPTGGTSRQQNAPILSADAQVVVYSAAGFFADNGVESIQSLAGMPLLNEHSWLVPVGQAYRLTLREGAHRRFVSFTYLQRDVPEGYEHALAVYFLPDGGDSWVRLEEGAAFVENLIVAEAQEQSGVYAVMASVALPALEPGWNLMAWPMPDSRPVQEGLASVLDCVDGIELANDTGAPPAELRVAVEMLKFGQVYWVHSNAGSAVTPYVAPPVRLPDGTLGSR
jgi:hypothetical protein